jgi:hypothetical protein
MKPQPQMKAAFATAGRPSTRFATQMNTGDALDGHEALGRELMEQLPETVDGFVRA